MATPEIAANQNRYREIAKEQAELRPIVETFAQWQRVDEQLRDTKALLDENDTDMVELAKSEIHQLEEKREELDKQLRALLIPKDPNEGKNVFLEIRAGTGGEEASLFVADLFRMYSRFAERQGWQTEIISSHETGLGGYKEIILLVKGKAAYHHLRFESGVHRVQRIPETESQGRIHTSAVTVAVLPEVDEVEVAIKEEDLRIDVFRSSGPGGQSVNTTDSAVRVTHLPTGIVVSCQDEKSQHKNKAKAMKVLRARILDHEQAKQQQSITEQRRSQVGSGDRSERVRTYNFPQNRVTDHRVNLTSHRLEQILDGDLQEVTATLNQGLLKEVAET